jgi:predicted PurR-regulated permease PerM
MNNEPAQIAANSSPTPTAVVETVIAPPPRTTVEAHSLAMTILAVLAGVFVLRWAQAVFIPLVVGVMINYALAPLVNRMEKWHIPRALGGAILLLGMVGGLCWMTYSLRQEASNLIQTLPEVAEKFRHTLNKEWGNSEGTMDKVQKAAIQLERAASETGASTPIVPRGVTRVQIERPKLNINDYLWNGTISLLGSVGIAVMVLFLAYFLIIAGDTFRRKLVKITGPTLNRKRVTVQMLNEITLQIQRYMLVQVFTSILVGVVTWLAFLWIGLEHAALWGIAAGFFNTIPYLGAVIITLVTAVVGFLQFETISMALLVGSISLVIHTLQGYLLTPWLTSRASEVSAVAVFVGVLFWGWLWGVWGLLLGVPIMMAIKTVCDQIEDFKPVGELLGK